jgi:hypothetical protein
MRQFRPENRQQEPLQANADSGRSLGKIRPVAAVIGLMTEESHAGAFDSIPGAPAVPAQQIDLRVETQVHQICEFSYRVGVSVCSLRVIGK